MNARKNTRMKYKERKNRERRGMKMKMKERIKAEGSYIRQGCTGSIISVDDRVSVSYFNAN